MPSAHTRPHELQRHIHPFGRLLRSHANIQKPPADRFHSFAHLDDVAVRIVKTHHTLSPGVLFDGVDIVDVKLPEFFRKGVEILLLKIDLAHLAAPAQFFGCLAEKRRPALAGLQG